MYGTVAILSTVGGSKVTAANDLFLFITISFHELTYKEARMNVSNQLITYDGVLCGNQRGFAYLA